MKLERLMALAGLTLVVLAVTQAIKPASARQQISGVNNNFWDQIDAAITGQDYAEGRRGGGID